MDNNSMTEQDSLKIITEMISKTRASSDDNGFEPIVWGSVVTICSLVTALQMFGVIGSLPFEIWNLIFVALAFQLGYTFLQTRRRKVKSFNDVALSFTWIAFGVSMGIMAFIISGIEADVFDKIPNYKEVRGNFRLGNHYTGIYLLIYGIPTFITGGIMKFKPMLIGGIICWVLALISVMTSAKIDFIFTAIAASSAWLIPGLIVNANYRKLKQANV